MILIKCVCLESIIVFLLLLFCIFHSSKFLLLFFGLADVALLTSFFKNDDENKKYLFLFSLHFSLVMCVLCGQG